MAQTVVGRIEKLCWYLVKTLQGEYRLARVTEVGQGEFKCSWIPVVVNDEDIQLQPGARIGSISYDVAVNSSWVETTLEVPVVAIILAGSGIDMPNFLPRPAKTA
ncbi:MAG: hypothetical protein WC508_05950 [Patescibacteria group bacterium]